MGYTIIDGQSLASPALFWIAIGACVLLLTKWPASRGVRYTMCAIIFLFTATLMFSLYNVSQVMEQEIARQHYGEAKDSCYRYLQENQKESFDDQAPWFLQHEYIGFGTEGDSIGIHSLLSYLAGDSKEVLRKNEFENKYRNINAVLTWRIGSPDIRKASNVVTCRYNLVTKSTDALATTAGYANCLKTVQQGGMSTSDCNNLYQSLDKEQMRGPN